jgi:hypothetical protein
MTLSRFVSGYWPAKASNINSRRHVLIRTLVMCIACFWFSSLRFAEVYIVYDMNGNMLPKNASWASSQAITIFIQLYCTT